MKHSAKKALIYLLVLTMCLGVLPLGAMAAEDAPTAAAPQTDPNKHVLDAGEVEPFGEGAHQDGDTAVSADGYFTFLWSAKTKVEAKEKTFEDGYKSTVRINFSNGATVTKDAIKFTTAGAASVKIWWAAGDAGRQMTILDASGTAVATTADETAKDALYISTLELTEAGTYYLGGAPKKNYIFKVEVTETAGEKEYVLDAASFTAADKAGAPDEKLGTDDYFTVSWGNKGKVDTTSTKFDDGYDPGMCINFGGGTPKDNASRFIKFTTSGKATVKIWWVSGGDNRNVHILDGEGEEVFVTTDGTEKNKAVITETELADAGTYTIATPDGTCYLMKVVVTEGAAEKPPRAAWDTVAAPEITSVEVVEGEKDGKKIAMIAVTVSALVGYDGGDDVTVIMRDEDGWELKSAKSLEEKGEHELKFEPSKSGTYTFEVASSREDEEVHKGTRTESFDFVLPLTAPVLKYAVNDGKGGVTVEWNAVSEATGYQLTVGKKTVDVTGTKGTVTGLTVGETLSVSVVAVRGESTGPAAKSEITVSDETDVAWVFAAFGTSTNTASDTAEVLEDGSVRVKSINGKGKVQPAAEDGLAFYYTAIDPDTTNFVLTVTANVNEWTYSNGQEGFGLLVMDQVGVNGSTAPVYSNSFMLGVTGLSIGAKRRLGVGALARTGVSEYSASAPATYKGTWLADLSGIDDNTIRNIVGNCSNPDKLAEYGASLTPALTSFKLKLEKNDEGYFVTYTDPNGVEYTEKYPETLNEVDDLIYVGMFAARNMDVTYTDITFTTSESSGSGTEEKEKTAEPDYSFKNPTVSNRESFDLDFRSNVDGKVVITDSKGTDVYRGLVKAGEKVTASVTLAAGDNTFTAVMTPDKDALTADGAKLTSYDEATRTVTVIYSVDTRTTIYVAPDGKADAKGTAADPTTLAEAVKNPAPGTVIILMEGTYDLTSGVTVDRGINGTEEKPITLKAADDAETRPVLDWNGKGNGLRINGDWWHLIGFDSTRSTGKGVHIGGNHNTVERVNVYRNANTGLSISKINFGNSIPDWPSYNTVLNCSSWLNADPGYEDADGFEAKLTVGVGNVFDGCIAAYNADDGWDLYARGTAIAPVTVRNSVAFKNGYDIIDGKEVNAGNGNGFKMGGGNFAVDHVIENSIAFANKSNGFTCNSNPNLKVKNCTAYANLGSGVTIYTNVADTSTAFAVHGFISYMNGDDSFKPQGTQVKADYLNDTNYFTGHTSGEKVAEDWFKSLDTDKAIKHGITRNADGTISLGGYLELTDKAPAGSGAKLPGSQGQNFRDIVPTAGYYAAVNDLVAKGLINGVTASEFKPGKTLTRAEAAMILFRASGYRTPNLLLLYTDVKEGQWFTEAVRYVTAEGIATGYGNGCFGPNDALTLEQLAVMLYRYEQNEKDGGFKGAWMYHLDVKDLEEIDDWAVEAVYWCVMNKVITVSADKLLHPQAIVTRAQAASIIDAYLNLK